MVFVCVGDGVGATEAVLPGNCCKLYDLVFLKAINLNLGKSKSNKSFLLNEK